MRDPLLLKRAMDTLVERGGIVANTKKTKGIDYIAGKIMVSLSKEVYLLVGARVTISSGINIGAG